jgi:hypothetical protein
MLSNSRVFDVIEIPSGILLVSNCKSISSSNPPPGLHLSASPKMNAVSQPRNVDESQLCEYTSGASSSEVIANTWHVSPAATVGVTVGV